LILAFKIGNLGLQLYNVGMAIGIIALQAGKLRLEGLPGAGGKNPQKRAGADVAEA